MSRSSYLLAALLGGVVFVAACQSTGWDQPTYRTPPATPENPTPAPEPVVDPDGTYRTVGEETADRIESGAAVGGATVGGLLGGPLAPLAPILAGQAASVVAALLRRRHPGAVAAPPESF